MNLPHKARTGIIKFSFNYGMKIETSQWFSEKYITGMVKAKDGFSRQNSFILTSCA
jgi:hypothetical protein